MRKKSITNGIVAFSALMGIYFLILTLISGWSFAIFQFLSFWYYIILLAGGFGVQVGLYSHLKNLIHGGNGKVLAISGTTSTAAMVSCCTHYLANILPLIATSGAVAFVGQYQVELFWAGLVFNALGIIYISNKISNFKLHENK